MPWYVYTIFIVYAVLVFGAMHLIARRAKARREKEEAELPEWRKKPLTKEQQPIVREQYLAYKAEVYQDYPDASRFEKNRHRWAIFVVLVYLFISLVRSITTVTTDVNLNANPGVTVVVALASCLVGAFFIFAFIENRKLTVLLYVIVLLQIVSYLQSFSEFGISSWGELVQAHISAFRYSPLPVAANILSVIYSVLLLLTALWFTVIRRNRELAEQVEMLNDKIKKEFKPTGI